MTLASLAEVFLADVSESIRSACQADDLDDWLAERLDEAENAWPNVSVEPDTFVRYLARLASKVGDPQTFRKLHTRELYLVVACLSGDAHALAAFEERHAPKIVAALRKLKLADGAIEDLTSALREQLLFGRDGASPLLADYSGRGDLTSWLRAIAVHAAFKIKKQAGRHVELDEAGILGEIESPEVDLLRQRHAAEFGHALARAIGALPTRARNLLRQHYLDGLNLDALAKLYRVHRSTLARWMAEARAQVLDSIKTDLAKRMTSSEIESFIRQTGADLGLRFSGIFRTHRAD